MRTFLAAALIGLVALVTSPAALAARPSLQSGVHVDPGSPAGKEYQIPLSGARNETAGGAQSGSGNPPLFGVGVTPGGPSAGASDGAPAATSDSGLARSAHHGSRSRARVIESSVSPAAQSQSLPAVGSPAVATTSSGGPGGSGWIPLVGGGLLVLVLGGGGGLVLRQRALRG